MSCKGRELLFKMNEFKDSLNSQKRELEEDKKFRKIANNLGSIINGRDFYADKDIVELHYEREREATEEDFKKVLKKYNLKKGLITLGSVSSFIYWTEDPNKINMVIYREPETDVLISQFSLAYLANILLISGGNDYKTKYISHKDNLILLIDSYYNRLINPPLTKLAPFMIRIDTEQLNFKFRSVHMIARTVLIFNELIRDIKPDKFDVLSDIFQRKTGLTIYDYLVLCFTVLIRSLRAVTFTINTFTDANIPELKQVLTEDKIIKFLNILKADYKKFLEEDIRMNQNLETLFTKTRFNPLLVYPIIETYAKEFGDPYVIPNILAYIKRAYGGLYWWFHRYFENQDKQLDFRTYFGDVFQEYVGRILKGIYGEEKVKPEIPYGSGLKFVDWWVERGDKIYLFESKAYQFALLSRQTGEAQIIIQNEIKKIVDSIEQVYRRVQDIPKYKELKRFMKKQIFPFIIFMDFPYISTNLLEPWIKAGLREIEQKEQITGLENFTVLLMNIEDLELYDAVVDDIELEEVFQKLKDNVRDSFESIIRKIKGTYDLRNRYLYKVYKDFMKMGFGRLAEPLEEENEEE